MATWTDWNLNDVFYGIILPCIAAFLILILPTEVQPILLEFDTSGTLAVIFGDGLGEAILTIGIPLFAGLIWNKWAGGGAGFILGSIYALYVNDIYAVTAATTGFGFTAMGMVGDISTLAFVIASMLTGYIAGALNRDSYSFKRMVVAALIASMIAGIFQLWTGLISPLGMVTDPLYSGFLILLPKLIYSILIPLFVTVFGWFGITPRQMT